MELKREGERVVCAHGLYGELGAYVVGTLLERLLAYAAAVGRACATVSEMSMLPLPCFMALPVAS